jgi:hypothetical protein
MVGIEMWKFVSSPRTSPATVLASASAMPYEPFKQVVGADRWIAVRRAVAERGLARTSRVRPAWGDERLWQGGPRRGPVSSVTSYWFPSDGHPDGKSSHAWFRLEGEWGYRANGHPEGPSVEPCLRVMRERVYATLSLPGLAEPLFEIVGSWVYPVGLDGPAWFTIDVYDRSRHPSVT